jgi:glycosyltransferase involved in cell wall biosynthesis
MVTTLSIVIPVFRNEENLQWLLDALVDISKRARVEYGTEIEIVFVDDASPDGCYRILADFLSTAPFASQLLLHSRNFGSFAAIRSGLQAASGDFFCVIAADLQEPPELVLQFLERLLTGVFDVVVGCRESREDPFFSRIAADIFWKLYRNFVIPEIPEKGVDVFGCNRPFREQLLRLGESNSSLIGLIFWLGFRRAEVVYTRQKRERGKSAWSLKKRVNYLLDSVFSFTDLPIRLVTLFGLFGLLVSSLLGLIVLIAKIHGGISVPGYAATLLTVVFFGALNSLGIGVIGTYAWRAFENTKSRPLAIVMAAQRFDGSHLNV